jgi:DNA-directed RNA polymerase subunit K/omega
MSQQSLEDERSNFEDISDETNVELSEEEISEESEQEKINDDGVEEEKENMEGGGAEESEDADNDDYREEYDKQYKTIGIEQSEDEEDEEEDENYLMKFDKEIRKNYLLDFHPETFINNYDEIQTLSSVKTDDDGVIIDEFHRTLPFLTKYEKTRVLGQRAKQINSGSKSYLDKSKLICNGKPIIDGYVIALKELEEKKIPFIIRRPLPNGACEYWRLQDLEIIN